MKWIQPIKLIIAIAFLTLGLVQNAIASSTLVTDAVGTQELWIFQNVLGSQRLTSKVNQTDNKGITQSWDTSGNLLSRTDAEGRITTYTYNATNQRASMTEASGTPQARTTTYEYVSADIDRVTKTIKPSIYGANTSEVVNTYDANLNLTAVTINGFDAQGNSVSRSTAFSHDSYGKVTSIDGPRTDVNDIATLVYYDCNTGAECGQLQQVTNAAGHITTYDSYDAAARLLQSTDPNGVVTTYTYHLRGWLLSKTQTPPSGSARVTTYEYDNAGQLIKTTQPDSVEQFYVYDAAHDLREISDNLGNKVTYTYDAKGNKTDELVYDPDGTLVRSTITVYDIRNFISSINSGGSVTQLINDAVGNLATQTDPNTNPTTNHSFDPLDRLTTTVDALSNNSNYSYNVADNLIQVTAPNGAVTTYEYDDLGNQTKEVSADRGTITYTHDSAGNVTNATDARGITVNYQYDALNRLTLASYSNTAENITYNYDAVCQFGVGRLCYVSDQSGDTEFDYDAWGNVVRTTKDEIDSTGNTIASLITEYSYDSANRVVQTTYPSGRIVDIIRDQLGRLVGMYTTSQSNQVALITDRQYNASGQWVYQRFGNGLVQTKSYDLQGRLTSHDAGSAYAQQYNYDANGNILQRSTLNNNDPVDYTYDVLDRLTEEDVNAGQSLRGFVYDANSNRIQNTIDAQISNLSYTLNTNRLDDIDQVQVAIDPSGRMISDQDGRTYIYNQAGRLSEIQDNGSSVAQHTYNSVNLRTRKIAGSAIRIYQYDFLGNLISERDPMGNFLQEYVYADGERIATFVDPGGAGGGNQNSNAISNGVSLSLQEAYGLNSNTDNSASGGIYLSNNETKITLHGNHWRAIPLDYIVTANTMLEFDFSSASESEIHGILLDDDLTTSSTRTFQLYGTQNYGIGDFRNYSGSGTQHYVIPVGEYYQGKMKHLAFVMDDDANNGGSSQFSNIKLYESATPKTISLSEQVAYLTNSSNPDNTASGGITLSNNDKTLSLTGNHWRGIPFDYNITRNTVLELDFSSHTQGEIHAVILNTPPSVVADQTFRFYGTQNWGVGDFDDYSGSGTSHYTVPVGQYYHGEVDYLGFAMDDDANAAGNSVFSDIKIYRTPLSNPDAVDVSAYQSYGGSQDKQNTGDVELLQDEGLRLYGNRWQRVFNPITITPGTEISFEFKSTSQGEIHAIGFDNDNSISGGNRFTLWGSQSSGSTDYYGYSGNGAYQTYNIPIGQYLSGSYNYITFAMDDDANAIGESVFRNVQVIDNAVPNADDGVHFYVNDHLGTPQTLTDAAGNPSWEAKYDAFGEATISNESVTNNHRFPGQYYDSETGLHYNWNRYYDAGTGRYVTSDPIGLDGGLNTFGYVGGNPLVYSDRFGLFDSGTYKPSPATRIGDRAIQGGKRGGALGLGIGIGVGVGEVLFGPIGPKGGNVIPFPSPPEPPTPGDNLQCEGPGRDDDGCKFTGLAGVVLSGGYGMNVQCQYKCPKKGFKIRTFSFGFRSANPSFLCPRRLPESSF